MAQIPDIIDTEGKVYTQNEDKVKAMAEHFFSPSVEADLQDIVIPTQVEELGTIMRVIEVTEVEEAIERLPNKKAPSQNGIPNELLKHCRKSLSKVLAELCNACISLGYHPKGFKESITIILKKPQKPRDDTPKAYRPIAPLNTMGKLLEKLVAKRISKSAEDHNLLPAEQMGARPNRSTIYAVELLTEQIHAIWSKDKTRVALLLSLDISGAFDNVPHERLIHNLTEKGIPRWITRFIESFLQERTTSIVLGTYKGKQTPTNTGIP